MSKPITLFISLVFASLFVVVAPVRSLSCVPDIWRANLSVLQGRVTDASPSGATIEGARVRVFRHLKDSDELVAESRTDFNGEFRMTDVKPGKYQLRVDYPNLFEPTYVEVELRGASSASKRGVALTLVTFGECTGIARVSTLETGRSSSKLAAEVKTEFLHAWNGYKKYAWGNDDLKPLSKSFHNWYSEPLLMTPVDALDTMYIMGFKKEADETRKYITETLKFDKDISVQNFEITIRLLGGMLSAYQITGDKKLLAMADDLGTRLLPVFNSPTGLPYRYVNLRTGKTRGEVSNPAETGTLLIEFGTLSKLTGKPIFYEKAKRALVETYKRRSPIGLVGTNINVETGKWTNTGSHLSAEIDSYYEYLLKCSKLFGDAECQTMWEDSISKVNSYLADEGENMSKKNVTGPVIIGDLWYGHADMNTGKRTATTSGALDAFFPAVLALDGDLNRARALQDSMFKMWNVHGIEPEVYNYKTGKVEHAGYPLRPEIVESTYYLYQYTRDPKYLAMGEKMWRDFVKHCRTDVGYAHLKSVVTKEKSDAQQSFLFAETFKYYYLLFSPDKTLDFKNVVFNTEAHPIKRTWK